MKQKIINIYGKIVKTQFYSELYTPECSRKILIYLFIILSTHTRMRASTVYAYTVKPTHASVRHYVLECSSMFQYVPE